jgi:hypothetical protein
MGMQSGGGKAWMTACSQKLLLCGDKPYAMWAVGREEGVGGKE